MSQPSVNQNGFLQTVKWNNFLCVHKKNNTLKEMGQLCNKNCEFISQTLFNKHISK